MEWHYGVAKIFAEPAARFEENILNDIAGVDSCSEFAIDAKPNESAE